MRILILFIFLFLQCCFSFNIYAQTGEIQGVVTDAETGETIPFVSVSIDINGSSISTATNFDGIYSLISIPPGIYTAIFSYVGFQTKHVENIQVNADKTTFLNTEISSHPQPDHHKVSSYGPSLKTDVVLSQSLSKKKRRKLRRAEHKRKKALKTKSH